MEHNFTQVRYVVDLDTVMDNMKYDHLNIAKSIDKTPRKVKVNQSQYRNRKVKIKGKGKNYSKCICNIRGGSTIQIKDVHTPKV